MLVKVLSFPCPPLLLYRACLNHALIAEGKGSALNFLDDMKL